MDIISRLKLFIDSMGMSSSQFADSAGIPRPTLSQILNGRNKKISNSLIEKIHHSFPALNVMWLMFGDGDMMLDGNIKISERKQESSLFDGDLHFAENQVDTSSIRGNLEIQDSSRKEETKPVAPIRQVLHNESTAEENPIEPVGQAYSPQDFAPAPYPHKAHPVRDQAVLESKGLDDELKEARGKSDRTKKIAYIMVFYTDNSFERFSPSDRVE